ncbi:glutathione S-transferase family protein [soil metagenome]
MYKLYNVKRWGSISAHLVLEELGVPYQNIWLTPEQVHAPEFREISPLGLIPALGLSDGRAVTESAAIVAFLTDAHPGKGIAPAVGSNDHAVYLSALTFMAVNLYPYISFSTDASLLADTPEQEKSINQKATLRANEIFDLLDGRLADDGPYLLGESYSAADIYLFMLTIWAQPSEASMLARCKNIALLADRVRQRPRLKAALESHGVLTSASIAA